MKWNRSSEKRSTLTVLILLFPVFAGVFMVMTGNADELSKIDDDPFVKETFCRPFIENLGQWDEQIDLLAETGFGHIALGRSFMTFDLVDEAEEGSVSGNILKYRLVGSNEVAPVGIERTSGVHNYIQGNDPSKWVSGARGFKGALYENIWDGIDLEYNSSGCDPKYEFRVEPFSDVTGIMIEVEGHRSIRVEDNTLMMEMENGRIFSESGLRVFYEDEERREIKSEFILVDENTFTFELGQYDRSRSIVIDPLIYSSFFGGTGSDDLGVSVVDDSGNVFAISTTWSLNMPTTPGAYSDNWTVFGTIGVLKMDPTLTNLHYSTYIGGSQFDMASSIALASGGDVVIAGKTNSDDFPITSGAYQEQLYTEFYKYGYYDLFVLRLNATGGKLIFSTFIGYNGTESDPKVVLDPQGNPVIAANVQNGNFTTSDDAFSGNFSGGGSDMVLFKMNSTGGKLLYSTFLGGSGTDTVGDIMIINNDLIYITGGTNSTDYPTTDGVHDRTYNHNNTDSNSFLTCINLSSGSLELSSYVSFGYGSAITLDDNLNIYIGGNTLTWRFEATEGAFQENRTAGGQEGFIVKMDANASKVLYATFLGGSHYDFVKDIQVNSTGCVFVTGNTYSIDFPTTSGAFRMNNSGRSDVFISTFLQDGSDLIYSSYLGGLSDDISYSVHVDSDRLAYISGSTSSSNFPATPASYNNRFTGINDLFLTKMDCSRVYLQPGPPLDLTGRMEGTNVFLEWEEPAVDGGCPVLDYNISRTIIGENGTFIGCTNGLNFTDTGIDIELTYYYTVTARNRIGTSQASDRIKIKELEPPVIHEDMTPTEIVPGMELTFMMNVTDNAKLVDARVIFWIDDGPVSNNTMSTSTEENIRSFTVALPDKEFDLNYYFFAADSKSNQVRTTARTVRVAGHYLPTFLEDGTKTSACPLEEMLFSTRIMDNWGIDSAYTEYWTNDGFHRNRTMVERSDGLFDHEIVITAIPGDRIFYKFSASDLHGNWNSTNVRSIEIADGEPPRMISDLTPDRGTTGEEFRFGVEVMDDNGVSSVVLIHRFGEGQEHSSKMENNGFIFVYEMMIPDTLEPLHYQFDLIDGSGNRNRSFERTIIIMDNDPPVLISDESDTEISTGGVFIFRCDVNDNIGIQKVIAEQSFGQGDSRKIMLSGKGGFFEGSIEIPSTAFGKMSYRFLITDQGGNTLTAPVVLVNIHDRQGPNILPQEDIITYIGKKIEIKIDVDDNIGVAHVVWSGLPTEWTGDRWEGSINISGEFIIEIFAWDTSDNEARSSFVVTVLSVDHDTDGDGLPDLFEMELGLDHFNGEDGAKDLDGDGLDNREEFNIGTLLDRNDTDNDGMPDGWEVGFGLDPITWSSLNDEDEDGYCDLEEFILGTDPTFFDHIEDNNDSRDVAFSNILLGMLIFIVLVILLFMIGKVRRRFDP